MTCKEALEDLESHNNNDVGRQVKLELAGNALPKVENWLNAFDLTALQHWYNHVVVKSMRALQVVNSMNPTMMCYLEMQSTL